MENLIGRTLQNRFKVLSYVASGGMSVVYRVWDVQRNVTLAMKVLHLDLMDDTKALKGFQREAKALQRLAHPNIVPFYGLYQEEDLHFLLELFVDGPSLKDILRKRKGKLSLPEVLIIFKALCAALGYAHTNGVVHCDVKPGNVMIDRSGQVFLTDFGVARHAESTTTTIGSAGTPAYMAPEQIRGEPVSAATDVYALGILLFELLTGQRPFRGDEAQIQNSEWTASERVRYAHLKLQPPDPRVFAPHLSMSLVNLIYKCLAKDPSRRYPDAPALFADLCLSLDASSAHIPERLINLQEDWYTSTPETPAKELTGKGELTNLLSSGKPKFWLVFAGLVTVSLFCFLSLFLIKPLLRFFGSNDDQGVALVTGVDHVLQTNAAALLVSTMTLEIGDSPGTSSLQSDPENIPSDTSMPSQTTAPPSTFTPYPTQTPLPVFTPTLWFTDTPVPSSTPQPTIDSDQPPDCSNAGEQWTSRIDNMQLICVPEAGAWVDQTEVTNAMYQRCVQDGSCSPPFFDANAVNFQNYYGNPTFNNYPVAGVNWSQAESYCRWAGRRLLSQREWQISGGINSNRTYPWGNDIGCGRLNYNPDGNYCGIEFTMMVASYSGGMSPYGIFDMAGNVFEWLQDSCSSGRMAIGGSWFDDADAARLDNPVCRQENAQSSKLGFRCGY